MKLYAEKLAAHLAGGALKPVYLLSGDEPLAMMECADAIRARAVELGYGEREVYEVDGDFDWSELAAASASLSLFADKRLLELRLPSGKPGREGGEALRAYAERPADDAVLLISAGKLDRRSTTSAWYKSLDRIGATIAVWPVGQRELPGWVAQRMRQRGMRPSREAAELIAERVEGNLLAAAQEVDKLALLHAGDGRGGGGRGGEVQIGLPEALAAVADSARYTIYDIADAALAGDAERAARALYGLRGEGGEPVLVLWALLREIRAGAQVARGVARGQPQNVAMREAKVWQSRQQLLGGALRRLPENAWPSLLARAARLELRVKGAVGGGDLWAELLDLALALAGQPLPLARDRTLRLA